MKERIMRFWRTFKHNLAYKDKYCKKVVVIMLTLLIIDLICLWVVW